MKNCSLCKSRNISLLDIAGDSRKYYLCQICRLISVAPEFHLKEEEEKNRYLKHNNSINNQGYVDFLYKVINPSLPYITPGMDVLDFGCGPVPNLSLLLKEKGIECFNFDPYFFPNLRGCKYDFIFSTECVEHFNNPHNSFLEIKSLLKPEAFLAIMTSTWETLEQFETWYYKRDATHVSFFHLETFHFLCKAYGFKMIFNDESRVFILKNLSKQ